jgi:hypothetical protein
MLRYPLLAMAALTLAGPVLAADVKTYQVTGPILDVSPDMITVQKGKDAWQLGRGADTKAPADLKKGDKVTVMYRMMATSVEVKAGGAKAPKAAAH